MSLATIKINLIGAGNVGFHLGKRLFEKGLPIRQVFSRTEEKAARLAVEIAAFYCTSLEKINPDCDVYILAVRDDVIGLVAKQLVQILPQDKLIVHTSGSIPATILKPHFKRYGVFYPLQTFTRDRAVNFSEIPICIDASNEEDRTLLMQLADKISDNTWFINDRERAILHVAAVIVNNFTNHLFYIGETILEKENLPFDLLRPLIQETVSKLDDHHAAEIQTGPAARGDKHTIQKQLDWLKTYPDFRKVYQVLTQSIEDTRKKNTGN